MASTSLADLTHDTRERAELFLAAAASAGFQLAVGSTFRSCKDQGTDTGPVLVQGMWIGRASGCRSWHVWGRAFDVVIKNDPSPERYAKLGALGKSLGLEWGGDFKTNYDPIHFQFPAGLDIKKLCPDPKDCENAVANAGVAMPPNLPPMPSPPSDKPKNAVLAFALAAAVGWAVVRIAQDKKLSLV